MLSFLQTVKSRPGWAESTLDVEVYEEAKRVGAPPQSLVSKEQALLHLDIARAKGLTGDSYSTLLLKTLQLH